MTDMSQVLAELERGKADAKAGRTTPVEPVLHRMLDVADELDAHQDRSDTAVLKA
jgi:hypothetical protein